jgi:hypothetical protein
MLTYFSSVAMKLKIPTVYPRLQNNTAHYIEVALCVDEN